jgi:hypothetical protein
MGQEVSLLKEVMLTEKALSAPDVEPAKWRERFTIHKLLEEEECLSVSTLYSLC